MLLFGLYIGIFPIRLAFYYFECAIVACAAWDVNLVYESNYIYSYTLVMRIINFALIK